MLTCTLIEQDREGILYYASKIPEEIVSYTDCHYYSQNKYRKLSERIIRNILPKFCCYWYQKCLSVWIRIDIWAIYWLNKDFINSVEVTE